MCADLRLVRDRNSLCFVTSAQQHGKELMEGQPTTIASKILQVVRAHPGCGLDDLVERLSDVQWSDVFVEVDRLSRAGQLRITKPDSGFLVMLHAVS
jgi:hypothetical protein